MINKLVSCFLYSITSDYETRNRVLRIQEKCNTGLQNTWTTIQMRSNKVEPLLYPLFFPCGENGWGHEIAEHVSFMSYLSSRILLPDI
jgi:hypothetical protein